MSSNVELTVDHNRYHLLDDTRPWLTMLVDLWFDNDRPWSRTMSSIILILNNHCVIYSTLMSSYSWLSRHLEKVVELLELSKLNSIVKPLDIYLKLTRQLSTYKFLRLDTPCQNVSTIMLKYMSSNLTTLSRHKILYVEPLDINVKLTWQPLTYKIWCLHKAIELLDIYVELTRKPSTYMSRSCRDVLTIMPKYMSSNSTTLLRHKILYVEPLDNPWHIRFYVSTRLSSCSTYIWAWLSRRLDKVVELLNIYVKLTRQLLTYMSRGCLATRHIQGCRVPRHICQANSTTLDI